jgi:hypothetical protein
MAVAAPRDAAGAFLTQATERQHQLLGSSLPPASTGRVLNSRPVPLQLPPGSVGLMARPAATLTSVPPSRLPAVAPAAGGPVDVSQKMLDALDKYAALQRQNSTRQDPRGTQLDVSP